MEYQPTEAAARLEQQVRELKARRDERTQIQHEVIAEAVAYQEQAVAEMAGRISRQLGLLPLSGEDIDRLDRENRERGQQQARELEYGQRWGTFCKIVPTEYRQEWDWQQVKPEVDRREVEKVWKWQFGPKGLFIAGPSGHSKTRAVGVLLRRLILSELRQVEFIDGIAFSKLCVRNFAGNDSDGRDLLRPLVDAEILVLDDMAKRWTATTEEGAFDVLERRTARKRPTIVTLNYTPEDLFKLQALRGEGAQTRDLASTIIRRLVDYCEEVVL